MATQILRPNGDGSETAIHSQYPGITSHYDKVDEVTADNASTTVYTENTVYERDLYALPAHSDYGVISNIAISFRGMCISTTSGKIKAALRINSTTYDGTEKSFASNNTWETFSQTYTTNPNSSNAWTWANIDDLEIGVSLKGDSKAQTFCTQVYVTVTYTKQWTGTINGITNPAAICGVDTTDIAEVNGIGPS